MRRWEIIYTLAAEMDIELTNDNLEYITFVARKYCNLYEECYGDLAIATALHIFKKRITQIEDPEKHNLYNNTEELQGSIKKYNLNPDKFWLLILFLKDFTNSCFGATHVFDKVSVGENAEKMMKMLVNAPFSADCEITISNGKESATINATWVESLVLNTSIEKLKHIRPMVKVDPNNQIHHKIKFFMDMLDYFLVNYDLTYSQVSKGIKDWEFTAKCLYLANLLYESKFYTGIELWEDKVKGTKQEMVAPVGKYLKNRTKNLKDTSDRHKSDYCYIPEHLI